MPARRSILLAAGAACGLALALPAQAQVKGVEIIAPAGPGGGYDQLARATQQVLESQGLASGVQVTNIPGAGGTIGLAQFVTGKKRGNNMLVAGLGMIGAITINKSAGYARSSDPPRPPDRRVPAPGGRGGQPDKDAR